MGYAAKKIEKKYTYKDYCSWPEDERWEIIEGVAFNMSAAPSGFHHGIAGEIFFQIRSFLKNKKCRVFFAPFDVRLPNKDEKDDDIETVVEPDIVVVCDNKKLDDRGCKGAPEWVIEIISPSTALKDMHEKYFLYEKHKVKEYWIVDPINKIVIVHKLDKTGKYGKGDTFSSIDIIKSRIFKGLKIDLKKVFNE